MSAAGDLTEAPVPNLDQCLVAFGCRWLDLLPPDQRAADPRGQSLQVRRACERALLVLAGRGTADQRFVAAVRWSFPEEEARTWAALMLDDAPSGGA